MDNDAFPLDATRSVEEIFRIVQALQTNAKHAVATPEGWKPGDKVIVPAPITQADQEKRLADSALEVTDWYFSKKELNR